MCLIISPRIPNPNEDPTLADKESILASLNIKAMQFQDSIGFHSHGHTNVTPLGSPITIKNRTAKMGTEVPMLTELGKLLNTDLCTVVC